MQKEIRKTWHFNQSPREVWAYLTQPELMEQWLMKSNFQPVVGHKFRFVGGCDDKAKDAAHCEVLEVTPYTRLSYSWQANSASDNKPFDSKVVWTLEPKDNGTELQLAHTGFKVMEDVVLHNDGWTRLGNKLVESLKAVKA